MLHYLVIIFIWIIGFVLSFVMLRVEHASEKLPYTYGDRFLNIVFSLLSFLMILILLSRAWLKLISITGYWSRPIGKK